MSKDKINISQAFEGTITGAIHRARFGEKFMKLKHFTSLMRYIKHEEACTVYGDFVQRFCTCGLDVLLTELD